MNRCCRSSRKTRAARGLSDVLLKEALADKDQRKLEVAWRTRFRLDSFAALSEAEQSFANVSEIKFVAVRLATAKNAEAAFPVIESIKDPDLPLRILSGGCEGRAQGRERRRPAGGASQRPGGGPDDQGSRLAAALRARNRRVICSNSVLATRPAIFDRERPAAEAMGISIHGQGHWRCRFAVLLARADLPAALGMLAGSQLEDQEAHGGRCRFRFNWFYRDAAVLLAADDPDSASRVLA